MVERMWDGGPLREVSPVRRDGWYGFTGRYVCDDCGVPASGIYEFLGDWLCTECKEAREVFGK